MAQQITAKKLAKNMIVSVAAQAVTLLVSFILYLVVPRYVSEYTYSYWQMYMLYIAYVGVLHFGLLDGLVLRYGAYDYNELDRSRIRSQFMMLLSMLSCFGALLGVTSIFVFEGERRFVFLLVAVGIVTKNLATYNSYIFQITNRIERYAAVTIVQRGLYGLISVALLLGKVDYFVWYCVADIAGDLLGFALGVLFNRAQVYFGRGIPRREFMEETKANLSAGILLMLANWSSVLLIGSARMITEWRWGELVFGKVSFAFSLTNVFLTFVTAVSVVLFPSLKRLDREKLPEMYGNIRKAISLFMCFALVMFFPGSYIVEKWIPAYAVSLQYLAILVPIVVFSSKVNLLTNNYLKVYRKEKSMLLVNLVSVALGAGLFFASAYLFDDLNILLYSVVVAIVFNSVLSEIVVMKLIGKRFYFSIFLEVAMAAGFIAIAVLLPLWWGMLAYFFLFLVYCALHYKTIAALLRKFRARRAA